MQCYMKTEGIKIDKHFHKNLGPYFTDGLGSDGSVVKGLSPNFVALAVIRNICCELQT